MVSGEAKPIVIFEKVGLGRFSFFIAISVFYFLARPDDPGRTGYFIFVISDTLSVPCSTAASQFTLSCRKGALPIAIGIIVQFATHREAKQHYSNLRSSPNPRNS